MDSTDSLNKIVKACQQGSSDAFNQLVEMYSSRCYGYFYRLTGNSAVSNDLLSDLFLKLVRKIKTFDGGSFEKWLFTTAANVFRDSLRKRYRQKKLLESKAQEIQLEDNAERVSSREMSDKLQMMLTRLDEETAELLMMRFYGDLSFKELAELRKEPIGTTLSKVHRGLKKLRELMEKSND